MALPEARAVELRSSWTRVLVRLGTWDPSCVLTCPPLASWPVTVPNLPDSWLCPSSPARQVQPHLTEVMLR